MWKKILLFFTGCVFLSIIKLIHMAQYKVDLKMTVMFCYVSKLHVCLGPLQG